MVAVLSVDHTLPQAELPRLFQLPLDQGGPAAGIIHLLLHDFQLVSQPGCFLIPAVKILACVPELGRQVLPIRCFLLDLDS